MLTPYEILEHAMAITLRSNGKAWHILDDAVMYLKDQDELEAYEQSYYAVYPNVNPREWHDVGEIEGIQHPARISAPLAAQLGHNLNLGDM